MWDPNPECAGIWIKTQATRGDAQRCISLIVAACCEASSHRLRPHSKQDYKVPILRGVVTTRIPLTLGPSHVKIPPTTPHTSQGYKRVIFAGKSGGGWTTTLMAALDPRISSASRGPSRPGPKRCLTCTSLLCSLFPDRWIDPIDFSAQVVGLRAKASPGAAAALHPKATQVSQATQAHSPQSTTSIAIHAHPPPPTPTHPT